MIRVVGLGPGDAELLTSQAAQALEWAEVVVGYKGYIELIAPETLQGKEVVATGMTGEVPRSVAALDHAAAGKRTVVVGSGDAGVYGLAGLVMELAVTQEAWCNIEIEVVPGIPAVIAAAALLGAPLTHDFAVVSLSDLLTPWEVIEKRLLMGAQADFVLALYNPRSKKRDWQLGRAREIILEHRDPATPVGVVRNAYRPDQEAVLTSLRELDIQLVDMFTILLIGNSHSKVLHGRLVTPRGYFDKYEIDTDS